MKSITLFLTFLALTTLCACNRSAESTESLASVADKATTQGEDAKLNVGFARVLGLKAEQPLRLKRLRFDEKAATHAVDVLQDDPNTIILTVRRQSLGTYYVTDRSGKLKRAVVNDGTIAKGGITNISLEAAAPDFAEQKRLWAQKQRG
jgi:hypothetical protein